MADPTNSEDYLAMDRRTFGEFVDRYVKEKNANPPLSVAARNCMESSEVISRLYHHLCGTRDSIDIQIKGDEVDLEWQLANARSLGLKNREIDKIKKQAAKNTGQKLRFATGLNAALAHVGWLYSQEFGLDAVTLERNELLTQLDRVRTAIETQRQAALSDEEGTIDYDEDMWIDLAWLIGPTPEG